MTSRLYVDRTSRRSQFTTTSTEDESGKTDSNKMHHQSFETATRTRTRTNGCQNETTCGTKELLIDEAIYKSGAE